jgi:hypothetical protein
MCQVQARLLLQHEGMHFLFAAEAWSTQRFCSPFHHFQCFNDHLPEHNKYCCTESIECQPKGSGIEMEFKEKVIVDEAEKPKGKGKKDKKKPKQPVAPEEVPGLQQDECELELSELMDSVSDLPGQELKDESIGSLMSQSFSEFGRSKKSKKKVKKEKKTAKAVVPAQEEDPLGAEEPELELSELMDSVSDLQPTYHTHSQKEDTVGPLMSQSFSDFGRGNPRTIAPAEPFTKELVKLRHTEFTKREYEWMTPEWIHAQLRKTERGRELLEKGDLSGKITDVQSLIDQGYISWQKPEWTQANLRHRSLRESQSQEDAVDRAMSHSFSDFGRDRPSSVDPQANLRHAEFERSGEYTWMTPEWINAQLRKTERGRKLLENGEDLCDVQSLIEQGYIGWEKPEWTQPKLRKTARGEAIVREAIAHENSFMEERANSFSHNSFSHNSFSN